MTRMVMSKGGRAADLQIMCLGPCEGSGTFPVREDDWNPEYRRLWEEAGKSWWKPGWNGWRFVRCPDCKGTGKR